MNKKWFKLIPNIFTKGYTQTTYFFSIRIKLYFQKQKLSVRSLCYIIVIKQK